MKRTINILIGILTYICLIPYMIGFIFTGIAIALNWLGANWFKLFTYPVIFCEWLALQVNK